MKFTAVVAFAAGALATAPTLVQRQASALVGDIGSISASAVALTSAISSFSGPGDAATVLSASNAVVSAIQKATTDASNSADLTTEQATSLVPPIQDLQTVVTNAINTIIGKKSVLVGYGLGSVVEEQIQNQITAANAFKAALVPKVPSSLQEIAGTLASQITAELQKGADAYQGTGGSTSSAAPTTTGGAAPTTSSGAAPTSTCDESSTSTTISSTCTETTLSTTCTETTTSASWVAPTTTPCTTASVPGLPTTSAPWTPITTGVVPVPTNGTGVSTPSVVPYHNGASTQAAGFAGFALAAVAAIAAF